MQENTLIIGYGSIGKRHAKNLIDLGITPYILTRYPDKLDAIFLKDISTLKDKNIGCCIISSPTARHLADFEKCLTHLKGIKKILIEKPLESSYLKGRHIKNLSHKYKLKIFVAYNLRFIRAFNAIAKFIKEYKNKIKIVEIIAGQDLRQWRPKRRLAFSYSSQRKQGGGVDLDLSHEIDYLLWLFGNGFKKRLIYRAKISDLKINSPDIFKLVLDYKKFIVDVTLDYIRKHRERYLKIICQNGKNLVYDFVTGNLKIDSKAILSNCDDINNSYKKMLRAFLDIDKAAKARLCSIEEGLNVLKVLEV